MAPRKRVKKGSDRAAVATPPVGGRVRKTAGKKGREDPAAPPLGDAAGPMEPISSPVPSAAADQESAAPEKWIVGGKFEILEKIARGGMCDLYLARQPGLGGSKWAVKILLEDLARDEGIVQRFLAEARMLAELQHPNIVKVVEVGQEKGLHYMAMNYIEGEDLAGRLERLKRLPEADVVSIAVHIARALECAHDYGVVHRDLKPSNIRIDHWGTVIVLDFGIARARDAANRALTRAGDRLGTPLYMSPEQIQGKAVDARSDLYSLGVILYELIDGRNPFEAENDHSVYSSHLYHLPPELRSVAAHVSERFSDIVGRLLRKDPAERPQTASELLAELRPLRRVTDLKTPKPGAAPQTADPAESQVPRDVPPTFFSEEAVGGEEGPSAELAPSEPATPVASPPTPQAPEPPKKLPVVGWPGLPGRLGVVSLVVLCVVVLGAIAFWAPWSPALPGQPVSIDASPFARVEILDSNGQVVREDQTPCVALLAPGSYLVRWRFRDRTKERKISVPIRDGQVLREVFLEEINVGGLLEGYLESPNSKVQESRVQESP